MAIQITVMTISMGFIFYALAYALIDLTRAVNAPEQATRPAPRPISKPAPEPTTRCVGCKNPLDWCECLPPTPHHEQCEKCGLYIEARTYNQLCDELDEPRELEIEELEGWGLMPCGEYWIDAELGDCVAGGDHKI